MRDIAAEMVQEWSGYMPPLTRQEDFEEFWKAAIAEARSAPLNTVRTQIPYPVRDARVYEVTFDGDCQTRIHGWLVLPASDPGPSGFPCLIHFHGFTGDRGRPFDYFPWTMMGVAAFSFDCRDQGGETGTSAPHRNGSMGSVYTRGILDEREYYVRSLYIDALRAIDFAASQPEVDAASIVLEGGSQGGGLAIAMAALDHRPILCMADVPSNSDMTTRVLGAHGVYSAVTDYARRHPDRLARCLQTLSYFDTMNLADRIRCEVFASVGGRDNVCPPKCFYATYNRIQAPKSLRVYPLNGHEGGGRVHMERKMALLASRLGMV